MMGTGLYFQRGFQRLLESTQGWFIRECRHKCLDTPFRQNYARKYVYMTYDDTAWERHKKGRTLVLPFRITHRSG